LLGFTADGLDLRSQREIAVDLAFLDENREVFIGFILAELRKNSFAIEIWLRIQGLEGRWDFIEHDFPIARFAFAHDSAAKALGGFAFSILAEIEQFFRAKQGEASSTAATNTFSASREISKNVGSDQIESVGKAAEDCRTPKPAELDD